MNASLIARIMKLCSEGSVATVDAANRFKQNREGDS
jgi:hypothetical protein